MMVCRQGKSGNILSYFLMKNSEIYLLFEV